MWLVQSSCIVGSSEVPRRENTPRHNEQRKHLPRQLLQRKVSRQSLHAIPNLNQAHWPSVLIVRVLMVLWFAFQIPSDDTQVAWVSNRIGSGSLPFARSGSSLEEGARLRSKALSHSRCSIIPCEEESISNANTDFWLTKGWSFGTYIDTFGRNCRSQMIYPIWSGGLVLVSKACSFVIIVRISFVTLQ